MHTCFVASSKDVKKKSSWGSIFDWHRKCIRPGSPEKRHNGTTPEKVSQSRAISQSPPPNRQVSRCITCNERPQYQPLPLTTNQLSDSLNDTDDPSDSCPEESDYEYRIISAKTSSPKVKLPDQFLFAKRKNCRERLNPITWPNDGKQQSHPLPLPPLTISNPSPFSPSSVRTSPSTQFGSPTSPAWKKGRLLGRGTFGQVSVGFNRETGEMCAMKEVILFSDDTKSKESAKQLQQEITFLSRLHHPNIVQYYGSATLDDKLYIYLEYVSGGSIHKILQEYGQLGEAAIRSYTQQILSGLAYLHAKNTLHRDIKGANILVDPSGRVKLADFGMAKHITGQSCPLSLKGSPYWMAPEVIKNSSSCNLAVDIWSLGCTVLEMATAKPPWSQFEGVAAMFKIGYSDELPVIPDHLSDEGKDFVIRCLQRNPFKRPTAVQLLEHPFVKSPASLERPENLFAVREMGFGHFDPPLCLDSPRVVNHSRNLKASPQFSDANTMRNISCPVSPTEFPLSASPMWSPRAKSDFSTPTGRGSGTLLIHHHKQPNNYLQKGVGFQNTVHQNSNGYPEQKSDKFRGNFKAHLETVPHKIDLLGSKAERPVLRDQTEKSYNPHLILADRVSKQLLINPLRLNSVLELNPNPSMLSRNNRI